MAGMDPFQLGAMVLIIVAIMIVANLFMFFYDKMQKANFYKESCEQNKAFYICNMPNNETVCYISKFDDKYMDCVR